MLPLDSYMSNLYSHLGCSTGAFQAVQLIVPVVFGALDESLVSSMLVPFLEISFNQ